MDDERSDQIEQLLVAAAGIMEDASAALLDVSVGTMAARISLAREAGARITILSQAAAALFERPEP
jgi:hypothetical protein